MQQLLVYTWPYALVFWTVFVWVFASESAIVARRQEPSSTPQDAHSKSILLVGQFIAMVAGFAVAFLAPSGSLAHAILWFWLGVATMIAGSLLRLHCRRMLGSSFTGAVIVRPGHEVVERGAYRYVRHPSYTAGALIFLGVGLALGNWIAALIIMAGVALVFGYRVSVEERTLLSVIGEPYRDYMARTKRFVPYLW
jgi:protein-S-isoprenylcysteine O-methyltransferase Ste14